MGTPDASLRRIVKHALAAASVATGGLAALRAGRRSLRGPAVRVFGYHRVVPDAGALGCCMPPMCVSTPTFAAHLDHLARHYAVLPLGEAAAILAGDAAWPRRDVAVITFDDAYRDVLEQAAPLLAARGLPATIFVTTGVADAGRPFVHDRIYALCRRAAAARLRLLALPAPAATRWPLARADWALLEAGPLPAADALLEALPLGEVERLGDELAARVGEPSGDEAPPALGWGELARLRDQGIAIGAHGVTHALLVHLSDEALAAELAEARATLAARLGVAPPAALAYPAGRFDARVVAAARRAGYTVALTTEDRPNRRGADPYRLGRKVLSEAHSDGVGAAPARTLVAAQLDGLFAELGLARLEPGDRPPEGAWLP